VIGNTNILKTGERTHNYTAVRRKVTQMNCRQEKEMDNTDILQKMNVKLRSTADRDRRE
jgi:hypothetical protein